MIVFGAYNYLPADILSIGSDDPTLGASITTIAGSDTLSNSRTTINNNFAALNTDKLEISDFLATSSMPTLVSVGTLTSGALGAGFTTVDVAQGGTGSTSLASNQVLLGNGSSLKTVVGLGTSGQFLTSNGAGTPPTWQTSALSLSDPYTWTGLHTFNGGLTSNATTTIAASSTTANALVLNGVPYKFPSTNGASSTVWATDGVGSLSSYHVSKLGAAYFITASTTNTTVTDTTTETTYGAGTLATIEGGSMSTNGAIEVKVWLSEWSDTDTNSVTYFRLKLGGTTVCVNLATQVPASGGDEMLITYLLFADNSESSQRCLTQMVNEDGLKNYIYNESTSSVDTTSDQALSLTMQWGLNSAGTETLTVESVSVRNLGHQ